MTERATSEAAGSLRPDTAAGLAAIVRQAADSGQAVEIVGGGSKRGLGAPVAAATQIALDRLGGVVDYEPAELVLTARPGTPLAEVEALLESHNQMLAFEPPDWTALLDSDGSRPTLGGTIACNAAGPRRIRAGAARDHMLGLHAVGGTGTAFKAGGKVVKNVTGYDLPKLIAGSFGTLAIMTELTVKVLPRPESGCTLVLAGLDDARAVAALRDAAATPYEPSGLAHLPAPAAARLGLAGAASLIRLEGTAATLGHRRDGLAAALAGFGAAETLERGASATLWRALGAAAPLDRASAVVWRASVAPMAGPALVAAQRPDDHFYDWAGGLVWLGFAQAEPDGGAARLRVALDQAGGGHATLFRAPPAARAALARAPRPDDPRDALARRVKAAFDPDGILNPGRLGGTL